MLILTLGQYSAAITAILLCAAMIIKYALLKPIKIYIDQATYPIHPEANGGRSLPDAIAGIGRIEKKINEIDQRLTHLEAKTRIKR
jgi:hypothetical protein